jgi:uncharacterized protein
MNNLKTTLLPLSLMLTVFGLALFLPIGSLPVPSVVAEAFFMLQDYAQAHVLLCLLPAFFIAGAISTFIQKETVMKYLGPGAKKSVSYLVSSVSGGVLAVCSCTILPMFSGIRSMGAGLGPATTFLYAGPSINITAIILTTRVLGFEIGIVRTVSAIVFSIVIGLIMQAIFKEETKPAPAMFTSNQFGSSDSSAGQAVKMIGAMVLVLIFAGLSAPCGTADTLLLRSMIFLAGIKWYLTIGASAVLFWMIIQWLKVSSKLMIIAMTPAAIVALFFDVNPQLPFTLAITGLSLLLWRSKGMAGQWLGSTWSFAKDIVPLLFWGITVAGLLLGRPGHQGLIPEGWIPAAVGNNGFISTFTASIVGAFTYFSSCTEVPILQGLLGNGMAKGPALALLLAGPALSLPNMLVIRKVLGNKKTAVYVSLVILMSTICGVLYGLFFTQALLVT